LADQFAGWSGYNYVLGNPTSVVDPSGMAAEDCCKELAEFAKGFHNGWWNNLGGMARSVLDGPAPVVQAALHPVKTATAVAGAVSEQAANFIGGDAGTKGEIVGGIASTVTVAVAASAGGGVSRAGTLKPGDAGRYGDLVRAGRTGDNLTPHHMPQAALGFTTAADGGAMALPHAEHVLTRTYGAAGRATARAEGGMPFRDVLARDFRDIRSNFGSRYNQGLRDVSTYYRDNFPQLIRR
jgi:hypothetical protein